MSAGMGSHTPGPWRVADEREKPDSTYPHMGVFIRDRSGDAGYYIAEMIGGTGSEMADAHLIAAAPLLLAALKRLRDLDVNCSQEEDQAAWAEAHAAIAKAQEVRTP